MGGGCLGEEGCTKMNIYIQWCFDWRVGVKVFWAAY